MPELHRARHTILHFDNEDENPLIDAGTAVGFLLGLHYACTYQRAALRLNKWVFDQTRVWPKQAIDLIAEAVSERLFGVKELTEGELRVKLMELSRRNEGVPDTKDGFWPLPQKPWEDSSLV